jgi:hypothetical protein
MKEKIEKLEMYSLIWDGKLIVSFALDMGLSIWGL